MTASLSKQLTVCSTTGRRKGAQHPAVCYHHARHLPSLSQCWSLCQKWELIFIKDGVKVNWQILLN